MDSVPHSLSISTANHSVVANPTGIDLVISSRNSPNDPMTSIVVVVVFHFVPSILISTSKWTAIRISIDLGIASTVSFCDPPFHDLLDPDSFDVLHSVSRPQ